MEFAKNDFISLFCFLFRALFGNCPWVLSMSSTPVVWNGGITWISQFFWLNTNLYFVLPTICTIICSLTYKTNHEMVDNFVCNWSTATGGLWNECLLHMSSYFNYWCMKNTDSYRYQNNGLFLMYFRNNFFPQTDNTW